MRSQCCKRNSAETASVWPGEEMTRRTMGTCAGCTSKNRTSSPHQGPDWRRNHAPPPATTHSSRQLGWCVPAHHSQLPPNSQVTFLKLIGSAGVRMHKQKQKQSQAEENLIFLFCKAGDTEAQDSRRVWGWQSRRGKAVDWQS